jgi:hypothetical protein
MISTTCPVTASVGQATEKPSSKRESTEAAFGGYLDLAKTIFCGAY